MKRLILLYPKPWRERYAREFDALLDEVQPTWRTALNIVSGAMKMQFQALRPWMLVPLCGAIGLASALTFLVATPDRYVSQAVFTVDGGELNGPLLEALSRSSLTQIIVRENLYRAERTRTRIEEVIERMKLDDIQVRPVAEHTFAVSFAADDPVTAQRTAQQLAVAFDEAQGVQLLGPASQAVRPPNPNRLRILFFGLIFGLAAGILTALFTGLKVWKLAAGFGVAGLLVAVIPFYFVDDVWSSSAVIAMRSADPAAVQKTIDEVTSPEHLKAFAKAWAIDEKWLRENLHIRIMAQGKVIWVQYRHKDRFKAQQVAGKFASTLLGSDAQLRLLDPASLPLDPVFPNRAMPAEAGLLIGVAGAIVMGMRRRSRIAVA
jgi:capsular polysaccharide biosynthesis protein